MKIPKSIVLIIIILASCGPAKTSITVINLSGHLIDSLKISSYGFMLNYKNLKPKDTISYSGKVDVRGDGVFSTLVYIDDSLVNASGFGYFSTQSDIKPQYTIQIHENFSITEH